MSTGRRHYRVAQKQVEQSPEKGTFVTKKKGHKITAIVLLVLVMIFIKGLLIGYIFGQRQK